MTEPELTRRELEAEHRLLRAEIRHLREIHTLTEKLNERALQLQAEENERRLEILNHDREREREERARTLSLEKWEEWHKGYEQFYEVVTTYIAHQQGRLAVWATLYGLVLLGASFVIAWFFR